MPKGETRLIGVAERVLIGDRKVPGFIGVEERGVRQPGAAEERHPNHEQSEPVRVAIEYSAAHARV